MPVSTKRILKGNSCMKSGHIWGDSSLSSVELIAYTVIKILLDPRCTWILGWGSMVCSELVFLQWNRSTAASTLYICTRLAVDFVKDGHCCAPHQLQPRKLYLATLRTFFLPVCPATRLHPLLITCCITSLASIWSEADFHNCPETPWLIVAELFWHYHQVSNAAGCWLLPKQLESQSTSPGVNSKTDAQVLPPETASMHLLPKPTHLLIHGHCECSVVRTPHAVAKWGQGKFYLFRAVWGFAFCTREVQQKVTLIIWIICVIHQFLWLVEIRNCCNSSVPRLWYQLESCCWETAVGLRCAWVGCTAGVALEAVSRMTGLCPGSASDTHGAQ